MAGGNIPNKIPTYSSGDIMQNPGVVITSNANAADGSDAVQFYEVPAGKYGKLRWVNIYSNGDSNGTEGKAILWIDSGDDGGKQPIGEVRWSLSVARRGIIAKINFEDFSDNNRIEPLYLGDIEKRRKLFIQIEDGSMSSGYIPFVVIEDMSWKEQLN